MSQNILINSVVFSAKLVTHALADWLFIVEMKYITLIASLLFILAFSSESIEGGILFDVLKHTAETTSKVSADLFDGKSLNFIKIIYMNNNAFAL